MSIELKESFGEWLNAKGISTEFALDEAASKKPAKKAAPAAASNKLPSTEKSIAKNPDFFGELAKVIGTEGQFLTSAAARQKLKDGYDGIIPVFINGEGGPQAKLYISKAYANEVKDRLDDAGYETEIIGGAALAVKSADGTETEIHIGKNEIKLEVGKGAGSGSAVEKYLVPPTPTQESIIASILQAKAENAVKDPGDVPECVKNFLGEKVIKKLSAFGRWLLSSNPVTHTGVCYYDSFRVPDDDVEGFQIELAHFLFNGTETWYKSFEKLYNSNILQEISSVFKNGVSNWKQALFLHFWRYFHGQDLRNTWVDQYLNDGRCGVVKDNVDKADIFLCFNPKTAQRIVQDLMTTKTRQEYFDKMTRYINEKSFIGISLKKIGSSVTLSAVNFKTYTNATGDNINPEKKVLLKFIKPGDKNNTLNIAGAKIMPATSDANVTYTIEVPFNPKHAHDLHMPDNSCMLITVRSNGSSFGKITVEAKFKNAAAQLGKLVEPLKEFFGYSPTDALKSRAKPRMSPQEVAAAYRSIAEDIINMFQQNEVVVYQILAQGIGYPIQVGKDPANVKIDSAPYIKIY